MKSLNKILTITVVAGSLGLAGLGIARAQAANTTTTPSAIDTAVTTDTTATPTTSTSPPPEVGDHHQQMLTNKAAEFNMSVTDLQNELNAGKPMYQIAAEHGVTYATEQAKSLAALKTRLDDMVKVKYMTQAEADAVYAAAQANPKIGMGHGFGGHGMMH